MLSLSKVSFLLAQASATAYGSDASYQRLSIPGNTLIPGEIVFSTFNWFGISGTNVTFTSVVPPDAPDLMQTARIIGPSVPPKLLPPRKPDTISKFNPSLPLPPRSPAAPSLLKAPPSQPRPAPSRVHTPPGVPPRGGGGGGGGGNSPLEGWKIAAVVCSVVGVSLLVGIAVGVICRKRQWWKMAGFPYLTGKVCLC